MNQTALRLAAATDFDAIADITNHYIRTSAIHFAYGDVTAADLSALWREHEAVYPWLVAEQDGRVAGYAKAGAYRARSAYLYTTETGIYLRPETRGRGLGFALYSRLLAVLRAQGFHSAIGGIALPNPASVRLHERLGFVPCGVVKEAGTKFGRWHDVGFWQLHFAAGAPPPGALGHPAAAFASST